MRTKKPKPIDSFKGINYFLSNFFIHPVEFEDVVYPTNEHAYVAAKTDNPAIRQAMLDTCPTAGEAKRFGRNPKLLQLREGWDDMKVSVMRDLLRKKFSDPKLRDKLLATGDNELIEGNTWHDQFWGVCKCGGHNEEGQNWLGRLLMEVRDEIRGDKLFP